MCNYVLAIVVYYFPSFIGLYYIEKDLVKYFDTTDKKDNIIIILTFDEDSYLLLKCFINILLGFEFIIKHD